MSHKIPSTISNQGHLPHAREQLSKNSINQSWSNNNVGNSYAVNIEINQGCQKCRKGESRQTKGAGISKLLAKLYVSLSSCILFGRSGIAIGLCFWTII